MCGLRRQCSGDLLPPSPPAEKAPLAKIVRGYAFTILGLHFDVAPISAEARFLTVPRQGSDLVQLQRIPVGARIPQLMVSSGRIQLIEIGSPPGRCNPWLRLYPFRNRRKRNRHRLGPENHRSSRSLVNMKKIFWQPLRTTVDLRPNGHRLKQQRVTGIFRCFSLNEFLYEFATVA
jgi:hypothetical protein